MSSIPLLYFPYNGFTIFRYGNMQIGGSCMNKILLAVCAFLLATPSVYATHSWGNYHWARTTSEFTLKLGNNLTSDWIPYLSQTSSDWSASSVLNTTVVSGMAGRNCKSVSGRVEICNKKYGNNGWLGIAQIWTNGDHITQALAKMNDTYFTSAKYNTPSWKQLVMCQEIAHGFGLDHQDEIFDNTNLGTCMDYTNNPFGPPSNEHPNTHDYEQLSLIYQHVDSTTTVSASASLLSAANDEAGDEPNAWGRKLKDNGSVGLYVRELGNGKKVFTHVYWIR